MEPFSRTALVIGSRSGKLEKIAALAEYLRTLDNGDLAAAARFFAGTPLAGRERRTLSIGTNAVVRVAQRLWRFDGAALHQAYRASGDLGDALAALVRQPSDTMLWSETLAPASLERLLEEIAEATGKNAAKRRESILERILRACTDPLVARYVVKILTGDVRIGLREGLIVDAIARAFSAEARLVRRAVMATGDVGAAAVAAKERSLEGLSVAYGVPIGFMLASPIPYGEVYDDLAGAAWIVEDKYDGIRAQAHVRSGNVRLFSRRLREITPSYPEVAAGLAAIAGDAILDGELVAIRDGRVRPFRALQTRLQRKAVDDALLREIPVAFVVFDLLAAGDAFLIDEPLGARRERLASIVPGDASVWIAPYERIGNAEAFDVNARFELSRSRGNEGLVFKRTDAAYLPGRRGRWWLKLKRELATLDVVVIAVEWGHGKRVRLLSDYTFAVRDDGGALAAIGKAYSGLTDAEIAELTPWFLEHRLGRQRPKARSGEIPVEPQIVLEVAFDVVAPSDLHESGFTLRFPRILRVRDDKPPEEIDTIERVREIYREMLIRESAEGGIPFPG